MTTKYQTYYVPAQSAWPIIGAIGLFLIAGLFVTDNVEFLAQEIMYNN